MPKWQNKVAVVTGASRGIGAGLAKHCARLGMNVVAVATCETTLGKLADEVAAQGGHLTPVVADVSDAEAVELLAGQVFSRFGAVHLLFNNAGIMITGKTWAKSRQEWERSYAVNVFGVVNGIRAFVPRMLDQGAPGRIVNSASAGGLTSTIAFMGLYQSTKASIIAISEALYQELSLEDAPLSVSVLCPGGVASDIYRRDARTAPSDGESVAELRVRKATTDMIQNGMGADEYAVRVFEEIEKDQFWIIVHEDFLPMIELRTAQIIQRLNPPVMSQILESLES